MSGILELKKGYYSTKSLYENFMRTLILDDWGEGVTVGSLLKSTEVYLNCMPEEEFNEYDIRMPLGYDTFNKRTILFPPYGSSHNLIVGETGTGKSETIMTQLAYLAATTNPSDNKFIIVDLDDALSTRTLAKLPHTIGYISKADKVIEMLKLYQEILEVRRIKFSNAGVVSLRDYNRNNPDNKLPHLHMVINEINSIPQDLKDSKEIEEFRNLIMNIMIKGKSFGAKLIVSAQKLGEPFLTKSSINLFGPKIVLAPNTDKEQVKSLLCNEREKTFVDNYKHPKNKRGVGIYKDKGSGIFTSINLALLDSHSVNMVSYIAKKWSYLKTKETYEPTLEKLSELLKE